MALDPNEVSVAPTGQLLLAPEGTAPPADLTAPWPAAWVDMGYLSEDALTMGSSADATEIMAWQSDYPVWSNVRISSTVAFQLMQWNGFNLEFAFGGGVYTPDAANGFWTYQAPPSAAFEVRALGLETIDGTKVRRVVWHRVKMSDRGDVVFRGDEASLLDLTVQLLDNGANPPWAMIAPLPVPVPRATGANAGNPGTFTPAGSRVPADLAEMNAAPPVVASPAAAWGSGEHVVLADASDAYWDGTAPWMTGQAP
jgi:hypothetical protein